MEAIYTIFRAAYLVEADLLGVRPEQFFPLKQKQIDLTNSTDNIFGAWVNNILGGAIFIEKSKGSITINNLVVDPKLVRRGIAKSLVGNCLQSYANNDFFVSTGKKNTPALQLYGAFGFKTIDEEVVEPNIQIVKLARIYLK